MSVRASVLSQTKDRCKLILTVKTRYFSSNNCFSKISQKLEDKRLSLFYIKGTETKGHGLVGDSSGRSMVGSEEVFSNLNDFMITSTFC